MPSKKPRINLKVREQTSRKESNKEHRIAITQSEKLINDRKKSRSLTSEDLIKVIGPVV